MEKQAQQNVRAHNHGVQRSLDYMRKRSLHRIWWNSARVALRRGQLGAPSQQPNGHPGTGKRV
jgi:hypothetical protein